MMSDSMTLLEKIIPKKYGQKERFATHEVMEILGIRQHETLYALDPQLKPIRTTSRIRIYLRAQIEAYLRIINC